MIEAIPGSVRSKFHPVLQELLFALKVDFVEPEHLFNRTRTIGNPRATGNYIPGLDVVSVNDRAPRPPTYGLDATLMHELIHWTGAWHRLGRIAVLRAEAGVGPTDTQRAMEEAIAELGVLKLAKALRLPTDHIEANSSLYLLGWGFFDAPMEAHQRAEQAVSFIMEALAAAKKEVDGISQAA